ncbi:aminopeptidase [Terrilactibacillus laevilacticus]|uniref:aminopeptidase n=1 Tax=Terrilactibacillus laevilacticus TaxID=1380157 RepID=UPI0011466254|nr:aminopeptidase [Terrilactibacillus laevilacticus]
MKDERIITLAKTLIHHSLNLKEKERVLISASLSSKPLIQALIDEAYASGCYPYVDLSDQEITKQLIMGYQEEQLATEEGWRHRIYHDVDAFIKIVANENDAELTDVPAEQMRRVGKALKKSNDYLISNLRWVLLNYPTPSLAQKAGMSTSKFTDYLLEVCNVDYEKMAKAQEPLKELLEKTDRVRIVSPGTDLTFSIKNIPVVPCAGENNIPDGEVFTAPVKDSVNGTITYNTPSPYQGITFNHVSLTFKDGKIIKATADNNNERLQEIFNTDEGARYVGEFAIGINPLIREPMGDILFDEKICGSIHFTPGQAYEDADNANRSSIHWDMVLIQRPEYGGGEIYFDDQLIRKDGQFIFEELKGLNPDQLH